MTSFGVGSSECNAEMQILVRIRTCLMHNRVVALIMITGLCCTTALAGEQKGSALADWLKVVQQKIKTIVPTKTLPRSTGVQVAREDAFVKLYWKGERTGEAVSEEEIIQFKAAIEPAVRGEREAAITGLEKFLEQYPDSALVPDAKKTLDLVKAEVVEEKKAAGTEDKKDK